MIREEIKMSLLLTEHYEEKDFHTLKGYQKYDGYKILLKAFEMNPESIIEEVKASGLRGRGGAGFLRGLNGAFYLRTLRVAICFAMQTRENPGLLRIV